MIMQKNRLMFKKGPYDLWMLKQSSYSTLKIKKGTLCFHSGGLSALNPSAASPTPRAPLHLQMLYDGQFSFSCYLSHLRNGRA